LLQQYGWLTPDNNLIKRVNETSDQAFEPHKLYKDVFVFSVSNDYIPPQIVEMMRNSNCVSTTCALIRATQIPMHEHTIDQNTLRPEGEIYVGLSNKFRVLTLQNEGQDPISVWLHPLTYGTVRTNGRHGFTQYLVQNDKNNTATHNFFGENGADVFAIKFRAK